MAEIVISVCIAFTPRKGGQAEIIKHPLLLHDSVDDAIKKIDAVVRKPGLQSELRNHLEELGASGSQQIDL